jgi:hypothetical protein
MVDEESDGIALRDSMRNSISVRGLW